LASFFGNIPTISEKVIWCFDVANAGRPIFTGLVVPKDEKKCVGQWDMGQRQWSVPSDQWSELRIESGNVEHLVYFVVPEVFSHELHELHEKALRTVLNVKAGFWKIQQAIACSGSHHRVRGRSGSCSLLWQRRPSTRRTRLQP
jgi:hypothetical protein